MQTLIGQLLNSTFRHTWHADLRNMDAKCGR